MAAWFALPSIEAWIAWCATWSLVAASAALFGSTETRIPHIRRAVLTVALLLLAGCLAAWVRSHIAGAAPIARPMVGTFTGRLLEREEQPALHRDRLVIAMREPESGRAIKVRINVPEDKRSARPPRAGEMLRFRARLMPPAAPMLPGGYDFARSAWFAGLAATGSVLDPVVVTGSDSATSTLGAWRTTLTRHVWSRLDPAVAGIAAALVTGDRGGISEQDDAAMRDAGLAHLLSISGLHVSAVIGAVYLMALRALALSTRLALRVRLPVLAAAAGALAGLGYTLLSGSEVPTVRSCIGAVLVLLAVALGREALSVRLLSVAALCVLLLWPEAIVGPSFQMSFAAVLAIVALEGSAPARRFLAVREESRAITMLRRAAMLLLTGIVIELALMPIGLFHFHRAGIYGALANVVAIPLTTVAIMPLVAAGLVLDLAGLGGPAWWLAGQAIRLLLALAHAMASLPGAVSLSPAMTATAFALFVAGGLWLALWQGQARLLGLVPVLAGSVLVAITPPPDILVSSDGRFVGLVAEGGNRLYLLRDTRSQFVRDNLIEAAGIEQAPLPIEHWPGARCNRDFCSVPFRKRGWTWHVLIARGQDAVPVRSLVAACERSDLVISGRWLPPACRPRWLKADRTLMERTGGLAIDLEGGSVKTVASGQGDHPWSRPR